MSRDGEVHIACNACCNALVLYVTQGRAEGVSGSHTHTHTHTHTQFVSTLERT